MKWSYGITTVPARADSLLPNTIVSLNRAGFTKPRLFVDGCQDPTLFYPFGLEVTTRWPAIRTHGNWILALYELFIREPDADRYAVFQDDLITYRNLKDYLERSPYPDKGYLNLYTFPHNLLRCNNQPGWSLSDQMGKGAVGLVFSNAAAVALLLSDHMLLRPKDAERGWRAIDGGIVTAMKKLEWREYIHNPTLVQHVGQQSVMGNMPHVQANSFRGEAFNALELPV